MSDDEETLIEEARSYVHPDSAHALYLIGALSDALESANTLLAAKDQALDEIKHALESGTWPGYGLTVERIERILTRLDTQGETK